MGKVPNFEGFRAVSHIPTPMDVKFATPQTSPLSVQRDSLQCCGLLSTGIMPAGKLLFLLTCSVSFRPKKLFSCNHKPLKYERYIYSWRRNVFPTLKTNQPQSSRSTVGDRAFPVAGPQVWNSLPLEVTSAPSLDTFHRRLKTHLFTVSYSNIQLS